MGLHKQEYGQQIWKMAGDLEHTTTKEKSIDLDFSVRQDANG